MKKIILFTFIFVILGCQQKNVTIERVLTNDSVQTWQMFRNNSPESGEREYITYYTFGNDSSLLKIQNCLGLQSNYNSIDWTGTWFINNDSLFFNNYPYHINKTFPKGINSKYKILKMAKDTLFLSQNQTPFYLLKVDKSHIENKCGLPIQVNNFENSGEIYSEDFYQIEEIIKSDRRFLEFNYNENFVNLWQILQNDKRLKQAECTFEQKKEDSSKSYIQIVISEGEIPLSAQVWVVFSNDEKMLSYELKRNINAIWRVISCHTEIRNKNVFPIF